MMPFAAAMIFGLPLATTFVGPVTAGLLVVFIVYVVTSTARARKDRLEVLRALQASDKAMSARLDRQDEFLKELKPNGGGSIKDSIAKISDKQGEIGSSVGTALEKVDRIDKALTEHLIFSAGKVAEVDAELKHLKD